MNRTYGELLERRKREPDVSWKLGTKNLNLAMENTEFQRRNLGHMNSDFALFIDRPQYDMFISKMSHTF